MTPPSPAPSDSADNREPTIDGKPLRQWLEGLLAGEIAIGEVICAVSKQASLNHQATIDGATVDLGRSERCGFGEVIYGEGKPDDLIIRIAKTQIEHGQNVLVTRIMPPSANQVAAHFCHAYVNPVARTLRIHPQKIGPATALSELEARNTTHVGVVTAGSTDAPVAEEAIETLAWLGVPFQRFDDIGVAGPQRLLSAVPRLRLADAVIVVAGMEGALPSAVAGHLSAPIFAVPTSVGYGATMGGWTALLGMLSSCSASVAVVNIDAGFKGGYMAGLVASRIRDAKA